MNVILWLNVISIEQEWIQLPVVSMRDRLEQVFRLVEDGLVPTTFPHNQIETGQSFLPDPNSLEIDYVSMPIATNPMTNRPSEPTTAQLMMAVENQKVTINNCISPTPIIKDEVVDGVTSSRSGISTATNSSTAAQQRQPFKMVKSSDVQQHSTTTTTKTRHQFDRLPADPYSVGAFRNAARGNESPSKVVNQVDWNEIIKLPDNSPALKTVYDIQDTVMSRQSTSGTALSVPELKERQDVDDDDGKLPETYVSNDEMATLDTPCPSANNSRSASSSSSSSSISSWKSQQESGGIDPDFHHSLGATGVDEQFLRTCSDAASLVNRDNRTLSAGPSISTAAGPRSGSTSTLNLNKKTISAKVSFIQAATNNVALATANGAHHHHSGDSVDLQCCLITQRNNFSVDT